MSATVPILIGSMALIFIAAVGFVNAIEYLGCRFHLGGSFVGAILAPLFTSLPELTIFLVAVFALGGEAGQEIGIGTLFGQPFMASSLSYGLVGIAALIGYFAKRRSNATLTVDKTLAIPYIFITILFPLTVVPPLFGVKFVNYIFGIVFFGAFLFYISLMYRRRAAALIENAEEAYLCRAGHRIMPSPTAWAVIQLVLTVVLIYIGSRYMVDSVEMLSGSLNIEPLALALIVVPAATAIPETISALIWGYRGRDTMSIGSLVGEKILYSTFYPGLGLFLTSWTLDIHAYTSVLATTVISIILLVFILKQKIPWWALCLGLVFFVGYAIMVFVLHV